MDIAKSGSTLAVTVPYNQESQQELLTGKLSVSTDKLRASSAGSLGDAPKILPLHNRRTQLSLSSLSLTRHKEPTEMEGLASQIQSRALHLEVDNGGAIIESEHCAIKLYQLQGQPEQPSIYVHSLAPETGKTEKDFEHFSEDLWRQVGKNGIKKIIALADPLFTPKYMPPQENCGNTKVTSIGLDVGCKRIFGDNVHVEVIAINKLKGFESLSTAEHEAREVIVRLQITEPDGQKKESEVAVDQIYGWYDTESLEPEQAMLIVSRFSENNLQVHCEGGLNRSPAAVVMYNLYQRRESLNPKNRVEEAAKEIANVRSKRQDSCAINEKMRVSIAKLLMRLTDGNANSISLSPPSERVLASSQTPISVFNIKHCDA